MSFVDYEDNIAACIFLTDIPLGNGDLDAAYLLDVHPACSECFRICG